MQSSLIKRYMFTKKNRFSFLTKRHRQIFFITWIEWHILSVFSFYYLSELDGFIFSCSKENVVAKLAFFRNSLLRHNRLNKEWSTVFIRVGALSYRRETCDDDRHQTIKTIIWVNKVVEHNLRPMESLSRSNSGSTLSRSTTPTIQQSNSRSPKDFVTRVLSPRIAVISSQDADQVCQANNFPDFFSLIKPFGDRIEGRGS